jgi:long-chain acyl-CoA synthetase
VVEGYCNQPAETTDLFSPGGYNTRDLLRQDADGYYWFVGRRSEMLKIGGIRVYPLEIEAALLAHPEVRDAVVVRAEERVRGEIARAVVELRPGSTADARALRAWCRDRLAVYMVPRIVEIWAALPRLPNGKLDKRAVAEAPPDPERHDRP